MRKWERFDNRIKRIYDVLFSIVFLGLMSPFLILIAIGIKLVSPGPVLYKAPRVGLNGRVFTIYKFRTMRKDSGAIKVTTLKNDERIFPFGDFLRRTKLDEFPQLVNILKGEMSVVGPRPEDVEIAKKIYVGPYKNIYSVKPGLTSPASLFDYTHGEKYTSEKKYEEKFLPRKLKMELYYVKHHNFLYDVIITIKTALIIGQIMLGKTEFLLPREYFLE